MLPDASTSGKTGDCDPSFIVELAVCICSFRQVPAKNSAQLDGLLNRNGSAAGNCDLMSREFPDRVNPWTAAEGGRIYSGTMPLNRLKRLVPLLASTDGTASFEAVFRLDEDRRPTIGLVVKADVSLMCQRSLSPYTEHIERDSLLGVIEEEAELALLPEHYEAAIADHGRVCFELLVEDELLLGLPQVPRNPGVKAVEYESAPRADSSGGEAQAQAGGPFAALAQLLPEKEEN
jgi:uncharacterized protein